MTSPDAKARCVLDSGALSAISERNAAARIRLDWVLKYGDKIEIPTAILVECTTGDGAHDAAVHRVLNILADAAATLLPLDEPLARRAGGLRFRARGDDAVDAVVAACAAGDGSPAFVLTSDPDDLERLLSREKNVSVRRV